MKRAFDILVSLFLLLTLFPVIGILVLLIRWKLGSPVLFRQIRPGLSGSLFEMMKFRSMADEKGDDGNLLPDEQRLTGFGHFLRASSLDELPGLWNVLKGDMSLIRSLLVL